MRLPVWLPSAVFLVAAPVATAATPDPAVVARKLYTMALRAYELQHYPEALGLFQDCYFRDALPEYMWGIAQSQRQLGQYDAAAKSYRAFVSRLPDDKAHADARDRANRFIERMETAREAQRAAADAPKAESPAAPMTSPAPPISVVQQQSVVVNVATPAPRQSATGWTLLGIGVVAGTVGAGLLGYAPTVGASAQKASTVAEQERDITTYNGEHVVGILAVSVGAALAVPGAVLVGVNAYRNHKR